MKLSGSQLLWIMFCFQIHYALTPALIHGRQDAWLVSLLAGVVTMACTILITRVSRLSPSHTLVGYSQLILGRWIGKCAVVPYFLAWFLLLASVLREWADYVYVNLLPTTPVWSVVVLMALLIAYVTLKGGITAIGRCSEVIGPIYVLISFGPILLMIGLMNWRYLEPVYVDSGWFNILKGILPTSADTMGGAMMPLMLTAFMSSPIKASSRALWAMGLSSLWIVLASAATVLIFGPYLSPLLTLPWVACIRSISILDFIQNIDAFAVFVYAFTHFVALSTSLFVTSYGIAEWANVKEWKWIAVVVVLLATLLVILTSNIGLLTNVYRQYIWMKWIFPLNIVGIPLMLWAVGSIRRVAAV